MTQRTYDTSSGGSYRERVATNSKVQEEKLLSWRCNEEETTQEESKQ